MFYGWVIVALAFVSKFLVIGTLIQCYPVFLLPLAEEFGIGRAEASLPTVAVTAAGVVVLPLVGRAVGLYPIRNVMISAAVVGALGLLGISLATSWWMILTLYAVAGSFALGATGISCNALVVNWFERRRVMALGIAMLGMSLSGAVLVPIASAALAAWGWRATYQGFACLVLVLVPLLAKLAVSRPSDLGLAPDGDEKSARSPAAPGAPGARDAAPSSTRELLGSGSLWMICAACGLVFFGVGGFSTHGIALAEDRGIEALRAAVLVSGFFMGAAAGKLVFGWLADRLGERRAFAVALVCASAALVGLLGFEAETALIASASLYGLGMGGVSPLQAALLARRFGTRDFGPVSGLVGPLMLPFQISGPPLAGMIFDARGSYDLALWIFLGAIGLAALALALIRLPGSSAAAPAPVAASAGIATD